MAKTKSHTQLARDLRGFLGDACPGIEVEVGLSERWRRTCLTFRWAGFDGLLLEERFRLLARRVPPDYYAQHLKNVVWLELTPEETVESFLAQPRSEDIDTELPKVWRMLRETNFFASLEDELVRIPPAQCPDDFTMSKRVLQAKQASAEQIRSACLAFMKHQAYNDWEVLRTVRPLVEEAAATKGKAKGRKA